MRAKCLSIVTKRFREYTTIGQNFQMMTLSPRDNMATPIGIQGVVASDWARHCKPCR